MWLIGRPLELEAVTGGAADDPAKPIPTELRYTSLVFNEYQDAQRLFRERLKLALPF